MDAQVTRCMKSVLSSTCQHCDICDVLTYKWRAITAGNCT